MSETVKLNVNQEKLLGNLSNAFTNTVTVLGELLQNARRANATRIRISHDEEHGTLVVEDDGIGIADMQKLLTVAESGWDEAIREEEHPYGMGFLSALYCSEHLRVESCGKALSSKTKDILAFRPVSVTDTFDAPAQGARITLTGFPPKDVGERLAKLVRGFPIPVWYNGEELWRPFAPEILDGAVQTRMGLIQAGGLPGNDRSPGNSWEAFLQGLPVLGLNNRPNGPNANVIHLDSRKYLARLPDRDCLINAETVQKEAVEVIRQLWRDYLVEVLEQDGPEAMLDEGSDVIGRFRLNDLLNRIDLVPGWCFERVVEQPYCPHDWEDGAFQSLKRHISRQELESGEIPLVASVYEDAEEMPLLTWIWKAGASAVIVNRLPGDHWLLDRVSKSSSEDVGVEIIGQHCSENYDGDWVWGKEVVLCRSYRLILDGHAVEVSDAPLYLDRENRILVPDRVPTSAVDDVLRQITDFTDEMDDYQEDVETRERHRFSRFVALLRDEPEERIVLELLKDAPLGTYGKLKRRMFLFGTNSEANADVVLDQEALCRGLGDRLGVEASKVAEILGTLLGERRRC